MKNKVKRYRQFSEMTQSQLADLIGVSRQTIHAIEKEKYVPSTVLALKLSRELKVKVEELFTLEIKD
ncbi:helix-turn-helix transcriptional regulator [Salibacter halophilus]|uniref:Helix-turn-helix transcriptional regulator n=1 Tax=Salibacter halophilus TaxID=1803916 RepID=A0A6N6M7P8_9FLAO|nr:helix-turn-helix transcriptional regulator [Salibacter halophilus]KAB1066108.1 helix-turn-helix transcriptional regulator [Salibacter halophilus]